MDLLGTFRTFRTLEHFRKRKQKMKTKKTF